jgi:hypothetical protein
MGFIFIFSSDLAAVFPLLLRIALNSPAHALYYSASQN